MKKSRMVHIFSRCFIKGALDRGTSWTWAPMRKYIKGERDLYVKTKASSRHFLMHFSRHSKMKLSYTALLALVSFAIASPTLNLPTSNVVKRAANAFTVGTKINIDGSTKYFVGTNAYWMSFLNDAGDVDQAMKNIAASGLKVLRVWGKIQFPLFLTLHLLIWLADTLLVFPCRFQRRNIDIWNLFPGFRVRPSTNH